jgi:predicted AlkP superfamily pyrophosphatase or phosphodiesterase
MNLREVLGLLLGLCLAIGPGTAGAQPPRLAVLVVVDQLGWETLERLRPKLGKGGFARLLNEGMVYDSANYSHAATYTGPGHACIATGSYADRHGIISNNYFDRSAGKSLTMLTDPEHPVLEAVPESEDDTSPRLLLGETVGDRLRLSTALAGKVVAVSLKDRSAVLLGGKLGAAYWRSESTGKMTSSTWYLPALPAWVAEFNAKHPGRFDANWTGASAWEAQFIKAAVSAEQLGQRGATDLLAVSFSAVDFVGHKHGPESREVEAAVLDVDQALADLLGFLEKQVGGRKHLTVVLTSDHGAAPTPETLAAHGYTAGRIKNATVRETLSRALSTRFGEGEWVLALHDPGIYLNEQLARARKVDFAQVQAVAAEAALQVPGIAAAYTRTQLVSGQLPKTPLVQAVQKSFHVARSGDLFLIPQPFFFWGKYGDATAGSTHGTPYSYDTHVPLVFWGAGVRRGEQHLAVDVADLAPTLGALLGLSPPAIAEGQVRPEVFATAD